MCAFKSRGVSVVCTWGLRGIFFLILVLFVLFPMVLCAFVWVLFPTFVLYNSPLSYVHTVLFSSTSGFMLKYAVCVLLTICRLTTWRHLTSSLLQPHPRNSIATIEFTSPPCNQTSFSPISTIEFTSLMVTNKSNRNKVTTVTRPTNWSTELKFYLEILTGSQMHFFIL